MSSTSASRPKQRWEPPAPEVLQEALPQYQITTLLGRGGMGAVYRGVQATLEREVAVKILPPDLSDPSRAERFRTEALAMAKLNHPGIVKVFDSGITADGLMYLVMEFVEGGDVLQLMSRKEGKLRPQDALAVTAHVCDALHYAHERGILHRDIKPANIMLTTEGALKIADFGLAKITQQGADGLTRSGSGMGTLAYMAPEALILGAGVDRRADVYAVGVMLYQMLTGRLPRGIFQPPSALVEGLDERFDAIVKQALMEERALRYSSTAELRSALEEILTRPVAKKEAPPTAAQPKPVPTSPPRAAAPPPRSPRPPTMPEQKKNSFPLVRTLSTLLIIASLVAVKFVQQPAEDSASASKAASNASAPTVENPTPASSPLPVVTTVNKAAATANPPAPSPAKVIDTMIVPPPPSKSVTQVSATPPPELAAILASFRDQLTTLVTRPHETNFAALRANYIRALQAREQTARRESNTRLQQLYQAETQTVAQNQPVGAANAAGLHPELIPLRTTWHKELAALDKTRAIARSGIQLRLAGDLEKLAASLTATRQSEAAYLRQLSQKLELPNGLERILGMSAP
jgi:serine/threonine protein kinase